TPTSQVLRQVLLYSTSSLVQYSINVVLHLDSHITSVETSALYSTYSLVQYSINVVLHLDSHITSVETSAL
ncbi:hypothetical protein J6590_104219, partial [Homalodisca vitripennis]